MKTTAALLCAALCAPAAAGAYTITPLAGGQSEITLVEGQSATIDFVITSDSMDELTSAIFSMVLTEPGLRIDGYTWGAPFGTGDVFDDSTLPPSQLPALLDSETHTAPGAPGGLIDFEFANALIGQSFTAGTLVSVDITLPVGLGFEGTAFLAVRPDQVFDGFEEIETRGGTVLTLNLLIPAPAGAAIAIGVVPVALRRRRG